jgi:hypothetical protein
VAGTRYSKYVSLASPRANRFTAFGASGWVWLPTSPHPIYNTVNHESHQNFCIENLSRLSRESDLCVPHHMITVVHTCKTRCYWHSSLWRPQKEPGLLSLMHMKSRTWLCPLFVLNHERNCSTASGFEPLILFSLCWMPLVFYSFWQHICFIFQLRYKLQQKTEICMSVGQVCV